MSAASSIVHRPWLDEDAALLQHNLGDFAGTNPPPAQLVNSGPKPFGPPPMKGPRPREFLQQLPPMGHDVSKVVPREGFAPSTSGPAGDSRRGLPRSLLLAQDYEFHPDGCSLVPSGAVAYDVNLRSIVGVSTGNSVPLVFDTSKVPRIIDLYREIASSFRRNDVRIARRIRGKYGAKERFKVEAILHKVTKDIVSDAAKNNEVIILENLKFVRNRHRKGSFENKRTREQLNKWSYRVCQGMIKYKAAWNGVPIEVVNPRNSSKRCCVCGAVNHELATDREWQCPNCGATLDRDVNAPINLLLAFLKKNETLRFGADWLADEAMRRWVAMTPSGEQMSASRHGRQNRGLA